MSLGAVPFDGGHGHNRVGQYPADNRLGVQIFESQSVTFLAGMSSETRHKSICFFFKGVSGPLHRKTGSRHRL